MKPSTRRALGFTLAVFAVGVASALALALGKAALVRLTQLPAPVVYDPCTK